MRFRRARPTDPDRPPRSLRARMLAVALAGAVNVFAFAPFGWWPLQILSLAVLFYQMLRGATVRTGLFIGWAYGFGWTAAGTWWLYVSLHRFGGLAAPLAAIAVALLAAGMGFYVALAMASAAWLRQRWILPLPLMNLLVLPACWMLAEWLRSWLFTGFPWLSAGYAHNHSPLAGYAPLLGVYGIGWLAALCAAALLLLAHRSRKIAAGLIVLVFGAGFGLGRIAWTHPQGRPITVRLLQGDVAQDEKFNAAHIREALEMYRAAITAAPADLIATPETAVAILPQNLAPDYLPALGRFAEQSGSHLLIGMPLADSASEYYNSAIGISPVAGAAWYRYDKHHLVPYGEFIPPGFRWFVDLMAIPLGDMSRGAPLQPAFQVRDQRVLPNICYEDLFGDEIAAQLAAPSGGQQAATILLNISNLAWFGDTIAIPQHLQISQMRSLETGRPMLR
ncbi:MAG TPA: apolipoprotein N-acyltransferase, partial [Janthinobacterium sp.]|nr:apolipoprotein N-acyltransferase [Janthinobacterium sp.]